MLELKIILKEKERADNLFKEAIDDIDIDIAIHEVDIAELKLRKLIIERKGIIDEDYDSGYDARL